MKHFYKIREGKVALGAGFNVPAGFTAYDPESVPEEIKLAMDSENPSPAEQLKAKLLSACDHKQSDVLRMILGDKYSPAQLERYKRKYEWAKAGDFSEAENAEIIAKHEGFLVEVDVFIKMIETARMTIADVIDAGELDRAEMLIETVSTLDKTATPEKLAEMLSA